MAHCCGRANSPRASSTGASTAAASGVGFARRPTGRSAPMRRGVSCMAGLVRDSWSSSTVKSSRAVAGLGSTTTRTRTGANLISKFTPRQQRSQQLARGPQMIADARNSIGRCLAGSWLAPAFRAGGEDGNERLPSDSQQTVGAERMDDSKLGRIILVMSHGAAFHHTSRDLAIQVPIQSRPPCATQQGRRVHAPTDPSSREVGR